MRRSRRGAKAHGIRIRFGAVGQHGSIAVVERFIRSLKEEGLGKLLASLCAAENLCHRHVGDYTMEDTSVGLVRFRNGAMASITGSNCALPMHFVGSWRVVCERAVLDYRTTGQAWVTPDEATLFTHDGETVASEHFKEDGDAYGAETDDFLQAIRIGGKTRSPARDGLNSLRVVLAVLESAQRGGTIVKM